MQPAVHRATIYFYSIVCCSRTLVKRVDARLRQLLFRLQKAARQEVQEGDMGKVQAIDVFHVWIWALLAYASWKGAYRKGCARRIHMGKLIYLTIASLDGYVADEDGEFGWAAPDEQVHAFINDLERGVGTYLYGRRMYEVMRYWET